MTQQIGRYRRNPAGRLWLRLTQVLLGVLNRVCSHFTCSDADDLLEI